MPDFTKALDVVRAQAPAPPLWPSFQRRHRSGAARPQAQPQWPEEIWGSAFHRTRIRSSVFHEQPAPGLYVLSAQRHPPRRKGNFLCTPCSACLPPRQGRFSGQGRRCLLWPISFLPAAGRVWPASDKRPRRTRSPVGTRRNEGQEMV